MAKKYFWLKLKEEFFRQKTIKKLRKIAGGDTYTIIYLKLQLLSIKDEGKLYFDGVEDSFIEELALVLDENIENIRVTLLFLESNNLIEILGKDEYFLPEAYNSLGKETESAERVRRHRENKKKEKELLQSNAQTLQSNTNVTKCNTEIEIDIKLEQEKKLEQELELDQEINKNKQEEKKQSINPVNFKNDLNLLKELVLKATGVDKKLIDNLLLPSKFRNYNISELIKKIKESDFLLGKLETKPKINNFVGDYCLNLMLADGYKNKEPVKSNEKPGVLEPEIDEPIDQDILKTLEGGNSG